MSFHFSFTDFKMSKVTSRDGNHTILFFQYFKAITHEFVHNSLMKISSKQNKYFVNQTTHAEFLLLDATSEDNKKITGGSSTPTV